MMKVKDICSFLDKAIPLSFQEQYDNSGLLVGDPESSVESALVALDATEEIVDEAIAKGCGLVITHHPLIFHPLKRLTGSTPVEKVVAKAVRHDIAVYSAHTNLDMLGNGVSRKMAEKLALVNVSILSPMKNRLMKLVTFVPESHVEKVRDAVFSAGAGITGNYDSCSFNAPGYGTFRGNEHTNPFAGEKGKMHHENEIRFETILLTHDREKVIAALLDSHPYEEVAYDLYSLENRYGGAGFGCVGELPQKISEMDFLLRLSDVFGSKTIRYTSLTSQMIGKVALCGGAGIRLLGEAIASGADAYVTGDVRYHDFFSADAKILLADIGHYESEKFSAEIIYDLIIKKFPTFALRFSETNTNPINYL